MGESDAYVVFGTVYVISYGFEKYLHGITGRFIYFIYFFCKSERKCVKEETKHGC